MKITEIKSGEFTYVDYNSKTGTTTEGRLFITGEIFSSEMVMFLAETLLPSEGFVEVRKLIGKTLIVMFQTRKEVASC